MALGEGVREGEKRLAEAMVEQAAEVEGGDLGADAGPESPARTCAREGEAEGADQGAEGGLDALAQTGEWAHDWSPWGGSGTQNSRVPGARPVGVPVTATQTSVAHVGQRRVQAGPG